MISSAIYLFIFITQNFNSFLDICLLLLLIILLSISYEIIKPGSCYEKNIKWLHHWFVCKLFNYQILELSQKRY